MTEPLGADMQCSSAFRGILQPKSPGVNWQPKNGCCSMRSTAAVLQFTDCSMITREEPVVSWKSAQYRQRSTAAVLQLTDCSMIVWKSLSYLGNQHNPVSATQQLCCSLLVVCDCREAAHVPVTSSSIQSVQHSSCAVAYHWCMIGVPCHNLASPVCQVASLLAVDWCMFCAHAVLSVAC